MTHNPPTCPLCPGAQPMEHSAAYDDWACPRCSLSAPPDVLERIRGMRSRVSVELTDRLEAAEADEKRWRELYELRSEALDVANDAHSEAEEDLANANARIAALEAELAQLKQPASVLADATRVWRMNCECACSACGILDDVLPDRGPHGGDHG